MSLNLQAQENILQLGQHQKLDASLAQVYIIENSGAKFENGTDLGQPVLTFHELPDHKCRQVWKIRKGRWFGPLTLYKDGHRHRDITHWFAHFEALRLKSWVSGFWPKNHCIVCEKVHSQ